MTKINKEEYKCLKSLDDKWKWIARNLNGALIIYISKPMKNPSLYWDDFGKRMDDRLFQFIKWEDREPYNIAELIEEYEHKEFYDYVGWKYAESEETEVNKDIQWLKREIHKELESWHGVEGGIDGDGINEIMLLINQLDEPETLSEDWIQEHSYNVHLLGTPDVTTVAVPREDLQNLLVPKQEVLSQEFIDKYKVDYDNWMPAVPIVHLQNLLVPKQELPVIPKFVAEVIEEHKERGYDVYDSIDLIIETNGGGLPSISNWVARNIDKYARAWLDGFTVEEEPLYRARLKVITDEFIASYLRTQSSDAEDRLKALEIGSKYIHEDYRHLSEFTEDELKRLNIWDSEQWEVEELEE